MVEVFVYLTCPTCFVYRLIKRLQGALELNFSLWVSEGGKEFLIQSKSFECYNLDTNPYFLLTVGCSKAS
jgi:hypothetical protein